MTPFGLRRGAAAAGPAASAAAAAPSSVSPTAAAGTSLRPPGSVAPPPEYPLVPPFSDFYLTMAEERRRILGGRSDDGRPSAHATLLDLLNRQAAAAEAAGAGGVYRQAEYVMAAFADETFRELHWPGRAEWIEQGLEQELFGSNDGRDEVYRRIDELLARPEAADLELARVDLAVLSLGFRGRYRGPEETSHIDAYRRDLFSVAYGTAPAPLPADTVLFPQAYEGIASRGRTLLLPALRTAAALCALAAAGYLVAAHVVWRLAVDEVAELVGRILALP